MAAGYLSEEDNLPTTPSPPNSPLAPGNHAVPVVRDLPTTRDPATIVTLAEDEYLYGLGPLRIRVHEVSPTRPEPGWAIVAGVRIDHLGRDREPREVLVRLDALRREMPPPERL